MEASLDWSLLNSAGFVSLVSNTAVSEQSNPE